MAMYPKLYLKQFSHYCCLWLNYIACLQPSTASKPSAASESSTASKAGAVFASALRYAVPAADLPADLAA